MEELRLFNKRLAESALIGLVTALPEEKTKRELLAEWFFSQVGTVEEPINKIIYNDWFYGKPVSGKGYAWCATFCCYGHDQIGVPYKPMGWLRGFCSVPDYHRKAKDAGLVTTEPKLMDDVIYDFEDDGADDHIGKFVKWIEPGVSFYAIEGNTSFDEKGSQSRGGAVAYKKRYMKSVSGFVSIEKYVS